MRFSPHLLDEIRARLPVSQVVARKVALKRRGREFVGLSPFKVERTPSFFVNDQKGFYHCFASGEHGDIFTFVMKTEGLAFPDAVERLAGEAGVALPKPDAREAAVEDRYQRLLAVVAASAEFFVTRLHSTAGTEARRYLERRGLKRETIERFGLGYAPNSRSVLKEHLAAAGFTADEMNASGMLISGDDIPVSYDRFRNRVMFPIADAKGRTIAFGGRALDADQPAKYLNSPETPLFRKGTILYNAHRARGPAHDKGRIIAVEGYMDAVALAEAGFEEAVAPLGTALTEDQLGLLWRMADEPILCFDGDGAGRRAAFRAVDVALPLLKPGRSVSFSLLPDGLDPDDLIRQRGPAAFESELRSPRTLFDILWEREQPQDRSSPEQRAAFELRLKTLAGNITDPAVRAQYLSEIKQTLWVWNRNVVRDRTAASNGARQQGAAFSRTQPSADWRQRERGRLGLKPQAARRSSAHSELGRRTQTLPPREVLILRTVLNHPWLVEEHAEEIAALPFDAPVLSTLRDAILSVHAHDNSLDSATLRSQLEKCLAEAVLESVSRAATHRSDRFAEPDAARAEVDVGWRHALVLHQRQVQLRSALEAAERGFHEDGSEQSLARILEIKRQLERLSAPETDDGEAQLGRAG